MALFDAEHIVSMTIYNTVTIDREGRLSLADGKTLEDALRLAYNLALENGAARNEIARQRLMRQMAAGGHADVFEPPWEYQGPKI